MSTDRTSAEAFGRLAAELQGADGVEQTVDTVVQFAVQAVWCQYASVVLIIRGRRPKIMALTDSTLAKLYQGQIDVGAGPMITALEQQAALVIPDVAAETRWSPQWSEQMITAGIRSAMHLPLLVAGRAEAVLSLYSDKPDAFTDDDLAVAHILAQHGSAAIASARNEVSLAQAVDARRLIGQAMGVLRSATTSTKRGRSKYCGATPRTTTASCATSLRNYSTPANCPKVPEPSCSGPVQADPPGAMRSSAATIRNAEKTCADHGAGRRLGAS